MFTPGQLVVCIAKEWGPVLDAVPGPPKHGKVYRIREVTTGRDEYGCVGTGLRLDEVRCGLSDSGVERAWNANQFRPLVKEAARVAELRSLLAPTKHERQIAEAVEALREEVLYESKGYRESVVRDTRTGRIVGKIVDDWGDWTAADEARVADLIKRWKLRRG